MTQQRGTQEPFTYMAFLIEPCDEVGRLWKTNINGTPVWGSVEEMIEFIDEILLAS